jgi:GT2 family glycosyltransferase
VLRGYVSDVAICIATFRRPAGLQRLLESFDKLTYDEGRIEVFVADNDAQHHAGYDYVIAHGARHRHKITCEIEPAAGISFARNRGLAMVSKAGRKFDYVAFTDDDIVVAQNWLSDLVRAARTYGAEVVFGKREPRFDTVPAPEILHAVFFRDEFDCPITGTEVTEGSTCNMLVSDSVFQKIGYAPFDCALSLSGGEDVDFCIQMRRRGLRFVSSACAVCYEFFPVERLNERWIINRYFRTGSTYAYMTKKYKPRILFYMNVVKKIVVLAKLYAAFWLRRDLSSKCRLYNTLGFFFFVINGRSFQEYGRPG